MKVRGADPPRSWKSMDNLRVGTSLSMVPSYPQSYIPQIQPTLDYVVLQHLLLKKDPRVSEPTWFKSTLFKDQLCFITLYIIDNAQHTELQSVLPPSLTPSLPSFSPARIYWMMENIEVCIYTTEYSIPVLPYMLGKSHTLKQKSFSSWNLHSSRAKKTINKISEIYS